MTLFDTSVIIDAADSESPWHVWAKEKIADAVSRGGAMINTVVLSEACVRAENPDGVAALLEKWGVQIAALPPAAAVPAAKAFALYLERRKASQSLQYKTPLPDFFVGAHADAEGLPLVTRDPERIRTYFPKVVITSP